MRHAALRCCLCATLANGPVSHWRFTMWEIGLVSANKLAVSKFLLPVLRVATRISESLACVRVRARGRARLRARGRVRVRVCVLV